MLAAFPDAASHIAQSIQLRNKSHTVRTAVLTVWD